MSHQTAVITPETLFSSTQLATFAEFDRMIRAGEKFDPGENAPLYGMYCTMRDKQQAALQSSNPYYSFQNNSNYSIGPYAPVHTMNAPIPHSHVTHTGYGPGYYTGNPYASTLPTYPHNRLPKPKFKSKYWRKDRDDRDDRGPRREDKPYNGRRMEAKGRSKGTTNAATLGDSGSSQPTTPVPDAHHQRTNAQAAYNHLDALDPATIHSALPAITQANTAKETPDGGAKVGEDVEEAERNTETEDMHTNATEGTNGGASSIVAREGEC